MADEQQKGVSRRGLFAAEKAGRGGDRVLGHLTPGELVVPVSCQSPELMALFAKIAHEKGVNPNRYIVGSEDASRNPKTGLEEFLEGESGGVGDTGGSGTGGNSSSGSGAGAGTGASASGKGGENSAHGETGNKGGYGEAGPDHGFGGYRGDAAVAGNAEAVADRGFFSDPVGYFSRAAQVNGEQAGMLGWGIGIAAPGLGTAMSIGPTAARSIGDGITEFGQDVFGVEASAPPGTVSHDYGDGTSGGSDGRPNPSAEIRQRARRGLLSSGRA